MARKQIAHISSTVLALCLLISTMLVQTPVMKIGTITAFGTMLLVIISAIFRGEMSLRVLRMPSGVAALIAFSFVVIATTIAGTGAIGMLLKLLLMMITCIVVSNVEINDREDELLKWAIIVSAFMYAVLTIRSCIADGPNRYMHADIKLFGTSFDPNYIGIPFTAGFALLLNNMLRGKRRLISMVMCSIIVVAIVYTASRGTMVSIVVTGLSVILVYFSDKKIAFPIKMFWLFAFSIVVIIGVEILSVKFEDGFSRMTTLEGSEDSRFRVWSGAIQLWSQSPIVGHGYRGMYMFAGFAAHNTYLQVLAESGIIGFAFISIFAISIIRRAAIEDKIRMCVLVGIFVQMFFLDALDNRCVWALLNWVVLGRKRER